MELWLTCSTPRSDRATQRLHHERGYATSPPRALARARESQWVVDEVVEFDPSQEALGEWKSVQQPHSPSSSSAGLCSPGAVVPGPDFLQLLVEEDGQN